jgi:hypothetical protein
MLVACGLVASACGGQTGALGVDAGPATDGPVDAPAAAEAPAPADAPGAADAPVAADAPGPTDAAVQDDAAAVSPDGGTWRDSLAVCWTDAACPRVMVIAHGGAWDLTSAPYDSNAAIANAYTVGCDGVKVDVRVTADDVPVISHSSPLEYYESLDCAGQKIEEMTAAEVTSCHRFPSLTEKFQRLDDVLGYVRGKMVVQLCVKLSTDIQRTIQEIHAQTAEDFAFIELGTADMQSLIPTLTGADTVWYLVSIGSLTDVDTLIDVVHNPRAFMYEFDPSVDVSTLTPTRLHPAGVRSFTYDSTTPLSVATIRGYFQGGYDVVSTQSAANGVQARQIVNTARGVSPP